MSIISSNTFKNGTDSKYLNGSVGVVVALLPRKAEGEWLVLNHWLLGHVCSSYLIYRLHVLKLDKEHMWIYVHVLHFIC